MRQARRALAWAALAALSLLPLPGDAQGLIDEDESTYRSFPSAPRYRAFLAPALDISGRFPRPGDQGEQSSCVAWAVGYGVRSYYESRNQGWSLDDQHHLFSPAYLYNRLQNGADAAHCDAGTRISDALNLLRQQGIATLADFPYDPLRCSQLPDARIESAAQSWRIDDWRRIEIDAVGALDDIKGQLAQGNPVVFGMKVPQNFHFLKAGEIYDDTQTTPRFGHALVIVGYNEATQAFKVMNSWGRDWSDGGFGWVSYHAFRAVVQQAFVVRMNIRPPPQVPYRQPEVAVLTPAPPSPPPSAQVKPAPPAANIVAPAPVATVTPVPRPFNLKVQPLPLLPPQPPLAQLLPLPPPSKVRPFLLKVQPLPALPPQPSLAQMLPLPVLPPPQARPAAPIAVVAIAPVPRPFILKVQPLPVLPSQPPLAQLLPLPKLSPAPAPAPPPAAVTPAPLPVPAVPSPPPPQTPVEPEVVPPVPAVAVAAPVPSPAPAAAAPLQLQEALRSYQCAKLEQAGGGSLVKGFVASEEDRAQLQDQVRAAGHADTALAVEVAPWPLCEALLTLDAPLRDSGGLGVSIAGAHGTPATLAEGEPLAIEVRTPDFPSYLYVTYVDSGGDAVWLYSPPGVLSRALPPHTRMTLGLAGGQYLYHIGAPFGHEMVVAVASASPLLDEAPPPSETERQYLTDFRAAYLAKSASGKSGRRIAAGVATLITREQPKLSAR